MKRRERCEKQGYNCEKEKFLKSGKAVRSKGKIKNVGETIVESRNGIGKRENRAHFGLTRILHISMHTYLTFTCTYIYTTFIYMYMYTLHLHVPFIYMYM